MKPLHIGLLGGSFNPPHAGHLHLAHHARNTLGLDEVWLLPVPLSTLKQQADVAPFEARLALCELLTKPYDWLQVKDFEATIATNETADTVAYVQEHFPQYDFTWLMGADSFASVHLWGRSADFPKHIKTAVFGRTTAENEAALASQSARTLPQLALNDFPHATAGWLFLAMPSHPARATDVRHSAALGERPEHISDEIWQEMRKSGFYQTT